ncbi:uncharacterized protein LOC130695243 [Daphnia carinata]|uniref:uncharacterized protein LOC130695243 n=1 Tax=Daphnia carinata TaxID=120202 RepID=UPI002868D758|nr:uncharacterized protein LOC130695243 [Daphnia carinata]XP_059351060.1 uncharacterized protein LOC130695243 [Daphnia carinata]
MQWSRWLLVVGLLLLWTASPASPSNASPRELKALRAALKKQQRIKDQLLQQQQQQQRSSSSSSSGGVNSKGASIGGSGEYVPDAGPWSSSSVDGNSEPSCEQLRLMWRQSKRHSRAAETTNEIPQYADPFARAASAHYARQRQQDLSSGAEPTLRPRQERRPVIYGRLHSSPSTASDEGADRPLRPFDVLRKLSWTESSAADGGPMESMNGQGRSSSGVVLYGDEDRSPFAKSPAKGSLQHLRELVREEQGRPAGVKGSFQQLRDMVREENQQARGGASSSRSDWSEADVGRVVTSPADHASKHLLFAMQGDAPYDSSGGGSSPQHQRGHSRRPSNANNYSRLSSFGKSHHRNHNSQNGNNKGQQQQQQQQQQQAMSEPLDAAAVAAASRKSFQLRDPPRPRISSSRLLGSQRAASANANKWTSSFAASSDSDDDVGVVRGYVVGKDGVKPLYSSSKPNRRSLTSATAEEDDDDCADEVVDTCRSHSDCRCASSGVQQRCQRGRCVPKNGGQKRQRSHQKRKAAATTPTRRLEDDERELNEDEWTQSDRDEPDPSRLEQLLQEDQQSEDETSDVWQDRPNSRKADTIRDIIDALQQIDQESTD